MSIVVQFHVDDATLTGLGMLCQARGMLPAELVAEIVSEYVKAHAPSMNGHREESGKVDSGSMEPDPVAALAVKRLGWKLDDPRLVDRRRDSLDALVGIAGDAEPVEDSDEVIYGR